MKLTDDEIRLAAQVGVERVLQVITRNLNETFGGTRNDIWHRHIEGAQGELVVAKHTGCPWNPYIGNTSRLTRDIGPYQVRTVNSDTKRLILHKGDIPDCPWILVSGHLGEYKIRGWNWGYEVMKKEYWEDPQGTNRHAYFAPLSILRPIETLPPWQEGGGLNGQKA